MLEYATALGAMDLASVTDKIVANPQILIGLVAGVLVILFMTTRKRR
jgi:hypothetical protein